MKKRIFSILLTLALLLSTAVFTAIPASAVVHNYGIYVGGIQVNEDNAADVLEDGTVSYDPTTNTLTLNNATITDYWTEELYGDESYYGIYSTVDGLTINLVGENKMEIKDDRENDTAAAIFSTKPLTVSGEGNIDIKCWCGVMCIEELTVKDCKMSFSAFGITAMGDLLVDNATLSAEMTLIGTENGNITLKNTTVADGGQYMSMYTMTGDITIENSDFTAHCTVAEEDETQCIMIGQGNLTVKNSKIDLISKMFTAFVGGKVVFENVSGSLEARGESGYVIYADGDIEMSDCDLTISCRATAGAAGGICSSFDVTIKNSSITMDIRATEDYGVGIGFPMADFGNVTISDSILDISVTGPIGAGIVSSNVKLTNCITKIEAVGNPNSDGFGVGIYATGGRVVINGGVADITATGPANGSPVSSGIIMSNELLLPEMIGADVKLRGNMAICAAPDLTLYGRDYEIVASANINGSEPVEYNKENIATYKYLHIHPFYTVTFNANGGTGTMDAVENLYGTFTIPENGFTAPEGKQFKGWAYADDGEVISETSLNVQQDIVLYAIWEDIPGGGGEDNLNGNDPNHTHSYSEDWKQTADEHYKECACGAKQYKGAHIDSNANGSCDVCGYVITESNDGALGAGAIVGIVIGSVAVAGVGGFALLWFVIKKKTWADLLVVFKKK